MSRKKQRWLMYARVSSSTTLAHDLTILRPLIPSKRTPLTAQHVQANNCAQCVHSSLQTGEHELLTRLLAHGGPNPWKVVIVLEELGVPYECVSGI